MIRIGHLDLSPGNRKSHWTDGGKVPQHLTKLLAPDPQKTLTPNAFLVDQAAGATVRSHFHVTSQFQVFVGGTGFLGRTPVHGFVAQYVAPHTGYGPIVAEEHGLWYLTLRPSAPSGARYLPEQRAELDMSLPKRQVTSAHFDAPAPGNDQAGQEMLVLEASGLGAWMVSVPAGRTVQPPAHPNGLARYYVVASGDITVQGERVGPLSLAWAEGDDMQMPLQAGSKGANVMVLQFPGDAY